MLLVVAFLVVRTWSPRNGLLERDEAGYEVDDVYIRMEYSFAREDLLRLSDSHKRLTMDMVRYPSAGLDLINSLARSCPGPEWLQCTACQAKHGPFEQCAPVSKNVRGWISLRGY